MEVRLDGDHVLLDVLRGHELLAPAAPAVLRGGRGRRPDLLPPAPHVKALRRRHRRRRRCRRRPGRGGRLGGPYGVDLVLLLLPTARFAAEPRHEKFRPEIKTILFYLNVASSSEMLSA